MCHREKGTLARLWDHFQKKHHLNSHKGRSCTCPRSFRRRPNQNISLCNVYFFLIFHQAEKENLRKKKHLDFLDILLEAKVSVDFFHWKFQIMIRFWETAHLPLP